MDATGGTGLKENLAGMLCYVFGWVTGLIFLLIDKRPFVKFHALQSIIVFGVLNVVQGSAVWVIAPMVGWGTVTALGSLLGLLSLACWIVCLIKAYQGERFKLPIVGAMAANLSKS